MLVSLENHETAEIQVVCQSEIVTSRIPFWDFHISRKLTALDVNFLFLKLSYLLLIIILLNDHLKVSTTSSMSPTLEKRDH